MSKHVHAIPSDVLAKAMSSASTYSSRAELNEAFDKALASLAARHGDGKSTIPTHTVITPAKHGELDRKMVCYYDDETKMCVCYKDYED